MNYEIIQGKWMPSREDREYKEEILEGVDDAVSTLERMISEERVEELLSTLTDLQRKVVHIHGCSSSILSRHGSQSIWSAIRSQLQWQSLTLDNR